MTTRNLLSGPITFTDAKARSANILHALQYPSQRSAFYRRIEGHRALLAEVVAHHLGTKPAEVDISPQEYWRHGSFNLCVPIGVLVDHSAQPHVPKRVFIRFPLPYRVGEAEKPGNSDEKLNCEAATNIFVDKDWKITCVIDLEFACSLPVEFLESPSCWLDDEMVHEMAPDDLASKHAEFLEHLRHEEQLQNCQQDRERLSSIMKQTWENGTFWFTLALKCPIAFNQILYDKILASYFAVPANELSKTDYSLAALTWRPNISDIIDRKLQDQEEYQNKLYQFFTDTT
ncbi:hypothetical protein MY11210_008058 [Beauveria gryllotalpidicola]